MLILDTNVISEILRQEPNESVVTWFESQPRHQLFTTAVTQAEILYGITLLPKGSRRQKLLDVGEMHQHLEHPQELVRLMKPSSAARDI